MPVTTVGRQAPSKRPAPIRLAIRLLNDRRVKYLIVGGIASAVYYAIFTAGWLLSDQHVPYLAMVVVANFWCAVLTYPLYRRGVFESTGPYLRGFLRFYVLCLGSLVFSFAGMPLLVEIVGVPVLVAQAILIVVWPLLNYQLSRRWAFRR
jgi:putative flippase GtrA